MKKLVFFFVATAIAGVPSASATCWRINPSPYAGAQFKTVADAMNDINVLPGDTLLLDPGYHSGCNLKRENMTVLGSGYFLDQNKQWSEAQETTISSVYLSKGCKIEGISTSYIECLESVNIKRCKVQSVSGSRNIIVEQCLITGSLYGVKENSIIRNNIINGRLNGSATGSIIENNTLIGNGAERIITSINNATIRNNIIINTRAGFDSNQVPYATYTLDFDANNRIQNNVFSTPAKYANENYPGNYYVGATIENTFVNTGSDDAKWMLLENSAAKGAATDGGDCGAFGGRTPYVLSGIPQFLPHITEALVPGKPTDGKITVKLKIANQNE